MRKLAQLQLGELTGKKKKPDKLQAGLQEESTVQDPNAPLGPHVMQTVPMSQTSVPQLTPPYRLLLCL